MMQQRPSGTAGALRTGFSTGACAAAAGSAAWLTRGSDRRLEVVRIRFPDRQIREMSLAESGRGRAMVIKDAGDDPDCTHGAHIYAAIMPCEPDSQHPADYVLQIARGVLVLRAVEGIGLCTRAGLDCAPGQWAINVMPRCMISDNLKHHGFGGRPGWMRLELGVKNGEALARQTLNRVLGIVGGISILGTSGLVQPYSHQAYIDTIRVLMNAAAAAGGTAAVLATGGRTCAAARTALPDVPEACFVMIGDFIKDALESAFAAGFRSVILACMSGKLCKYALGYRNTHAKQAHQDLSPLWEIVAELAPGDLDRVRAVPTMREALLAFSGEQRRGILKRLTGRAVEKLREHAPGLAIRILLFDFDRALLIDSDTESER